MSAVLSASCCFRHAMAVTALLLVLAPSTTAQQTIPRTVEGHPDFQGVWDAPWLTPLERPANISSLVVSEDEAKAIADARRQLSSRNPLNVPSILDATDYGSLNKVRGERRTSLIIDPSDGKTPYTEIGRQLSTWTPSYEGPETMQLQSRCIVTSGAPPMFIMPADTLRQIVQTRDTVVVLSEVMNDLRIIPVGAPHRRPELTSVFGDSVGYWEGDELVVETTHFRSDMQVRSLAGTRMILGADTKVTERFAYYTPDELVYRFTVEDPAFYTRAWSGEYTLVRRAVRLFETACHEGNYAMANLLRGARADERRATDRPSP